MDAAAAAWVLAQVPGARRVVGARRLTGGATSSVHAVSLETATGRRRRVVLRRWTGAPWPDGTVDDGEQCTRREAAVLTLLDDSDLPAPRLLAVDPGGQQCGLPAVLMTMLPGRIELTPGDPAGWLRALAAMLPRIHAVAPTGLPAYETWLRVGGAVPSWTAHPALWRRAIEIARAAPSADGGLVHHDYQEFNVLWRHGGISGVVDWTWASQGPPDDDVLHCWLNLVLVHGPDWAERFRRAYEAEAGRGFGPWWQVAGCVDGLRHWLDWDFGRQAGRRLRVDPAQFPARLDRALADAMHRYDG